MGFSDRTKKGIDTSTRAWINILKGKKSPEIIGNELDKHYNDLKEYEDKEKKNKKKKWFD